MPDTTNKDILQGILDSKPEPTVEPLVKETIETTKTPQRSEQFASLLERAKASKQGVQKSDKLTGLITRAKQAKEETATQMGVKQKAVMLGIEIEPEQVQTGTPEFKQVLQGLQPENQLDFSTIGGTAKAIGGATLETGATFLEAGKNIPASAGRLVKDVFSAVTSPVQTAKSLGGLGLGLVQKLIPGEQDSEMFVDALVQNYSDRFGSLEKAKETFTNDPVGFLSDTAGVLLLAGGSLKGVGAVSKLNKLQKLKKVVVVGKKLGEVGTAITKVGTAIDPLTQVSKVGKPVAKVLTKSAESGIEKVLAPTKEVTKAKTTKILPQLTQERFKAMSTEGLRKQVQDRIKTVGREFDDLIAEKGIQGTSKTEVFIEALEKAKDQFKVGDKIIENAPIKTLEGLQETLTQFGDEIPNTELRRVRQIWDKTIAQGKRFDVQKTAEAVDALDFKKIVTDSIREELSKTNPELAQLNKKFSFYKNIDDVLFETVRRKKGQAGGLGKKLGFIAGLATGDGVIGKLVNATALSTFIKSIESTAWRTISSDLKLRLAESFASGNKTKISNVLRQIEKIKED